MPGPSTLPQGLTNGSVLLVYDAGSMYLKFAVVMLEAKRG